MTSSCSTTSASTSPDRAAELLPGVLDRARAAGARQIGLGSRPDDPSRAAVAALPGFVSRATNMALPLDGEIADPGDLRAAADDGGRSSTTSWR